MNKAHYFLIVLLLSGNAFAFTSVDTNKYTTSFSKKYSNSYSLDRCFDSNDSTTCASVENGNLTIEFNKLSKVDNLTLKLASTTYLYSHLDVDGVRHNYKTSGIYSFPKAKKIVIYAGTSSYVYLKEITFSFTDFVNTGITNNIANGVNWSMFSYSFSVVAFLSLFGRGIKAVLDLIKYG